MTSEPDYDYSELYLGGAPPLSYFYERTEIIKDLAERSTALKAHEGQVWLELCLVGLASYFEAFCKAHFAAVVNILPSSLEKFSTRRKNCMLELGEVLRVSPAIERRLGSLLSEQFDFGSPKTINSLYFDLLAVTPFSAKELRKMSEFLRMRNLLVHHGGVFTFKDPVPVPGATPHRDSVALSKDDIGKWSTFLFDVAQKMARRTKDVLEKEVKEGAGKLDRNRELALILLDVT